MGILPRKSAVKRSIIVGVLKVIHCGVAEWIFDLSESLPYVDHDIFRQPTCIMHPS